MALQFRYLADFQFGTTTSPVSISDTTVASSEFSALRALSSGTTYIPIVLLDPSTQVYEVVWMSLHGPSATSGTVARGQEGSVAREWPSGTQWIIAPTMRDSLTTESLAGLPADAHVGQRMTVGDKGDVRQMTFSQGWQGFVYGGREDLGRALDGTTSHPNGVIPILKTFVLSGNTNAGGLATFSIPNGGYPTRLVSAVVCRAAGTIWYNPILDLGNTTKTTLAVQCQTASGVNLASSAIIISAICIGY